MMDRDSTCVSVRVMKLPHYVLIAMSLISAICAWLVAQNAAGSIVLPAVVLGIIPTIQAVLGILSPAATAGSSASSTRGYIRTGVMAGVAFVGLIAVGLAGCPKFAPAIVPGIDCGVRIVDDALAGDTIAQIQTDVGPTCAADVAAIVAAIVSTHSDQVRATRAYHEATATDGGRE